MTRPRPCKREDLERSMGLPRNKLKGARAKKPSERVGSPEGQSPVPDVSPEKATNAFLIQCTLGEYAALVQRESHSPLKFAPLQFSFHIKNTSKSR